MEVLGLVGRNLVFLLSQSQFILFFPFFFFFSFRNFVMRLMYGVEGAQHET